MYGLRKGCYQGRRAFCRGVFGKEGDNGDEGETFIKGGLMFYLIVYYNDFWWVCVCKRGNGGERILKRDGVLVMYV